MSPVFQLVSRLVAFLLCGLLGLLPAVAVAGPGAEVTPLGDLPQRWAADSWSLLRAPADWRQPQWQAVGLIAAGSLGLYLLDDEIAEKVQANRSGLSDSVSDFAKNFGEPWLLVAGGGGLYLAGRLRDDAYLAETGLLSLESYLLTGVAVLGLKHLGRRHRPNSGEDSDHWDGPGLSDRGGSGEPDGFSFPSGHAAGSFAVASVLVARYPESRWLPWTAYGLAGLTAFSRLNDNEHWASDVTVGAVLGLAVGKGVCLLAEKHRIALRLVPLLEPDAAGLALVGRF
ncbi:hypothetical protein B5V00_13355 [Geothermobacter hydrogeniphilus]|uniref:Phosphatidic acid phosphatase type 2/haloperoxidase domain-containing protein n=1 Tax=Geothermobacter hydrogeniphilus TaxID=1969733 RepID=A0A1X0XXJ5_9BACT|nr:hypothetical protein B5V00_13355 [Geothermobacter hydrogeniphilus]